MDGNILMPRPKADIRISIKIRGRPTRKLELIRQPIGHKYWIRVDGRPSGKLPHGTPSEIADGIRRWIVATAPKAGYC